MAIKEDLVINIDLQSEKAQGNIEVLSKDFNSFNEEISRFEKSSSDYINKISISFEKISKDIKASSGSFNGNSKSVINLSNNANSLNEEYKELSKNSNDLVSYNKNLTTTFDDISSTLSSVTSSVNSMVLFMGNLAQVIEFISDPERVKRLSRLLRALSFGAKIKGFDSLSKSLLSSSESVDIYGEQIERAGKKSDEFFDNLERLNHASRAYEVSTNVLGIAMKASLAAGAVVAANKMGLFSAAFEKSDEVLKAAKFSASNFGSILSRNLTPGLISLYEGSVFLTPALASLGATLFTLSDSKIGKFSGMLLIAASIMTGSFVAAVSVLVSSLSSLVYSFGTAIISSMDKFESKFQKAQTVVNQFTFTIKGFVKTLGEDSVGSLSLWEKKVKEMTETTSFGANEVMKSIKLLVAEGAALGLTVEENTAILERASDIAANTGSDLNEVILKIVQGLSGNSQALLSLGINVSKTHLEHSKLTKSMGMTVDQMTEQEVQSLRLKEIFKQTIPIIGASSVALNTIEGSTKKYNQAVEQLQVGLGSQADLVVVYNNIMTSFVRNLANIPKQFLKIASSVLDVSGVVFVVIGSFLKVSLVFLSVRTSLILLNAALNENIYLQKVLGSTLSFIGSKIGVQTVAVNSASTAWVSFSSVVKKAALLSLASLVSGLKLAISYIKIMTVAVLTNPIFLTFSAISAAVLILVQAYSEMKDELALVFFKNEDLKKSAEDSISIWQTLGNAIKAVMNWMVEFAKVVIIGWFKIVEFLKIISSYIASAVTEFFGFYEQAIKFNNILSESVDRFNALSNIGSNSLAYITSGLGGTAMAAESLETKLNKVEKSLKKINRSISEKRAFEIRLEILGTDAEKAVEDFFKKNIEFNQLIEKSSRSKKVDSEIEKKIMEKKVELAKAYLSIQKSQEQAQSEISKRLQESNIKALEDQGQFVKAEEIRQSIIKKNFQEQITQYKKLAEVTGKQVKGVKELEKALKDQEIAALKAAKIKQDEKRLKPFLDKLKEINEQTKRLNEESESYGKSAYDSIRDVSSVRQKEINQLEEQLKLEGILDKATQDRLKNAREAISKNEEKKLKSLSTKDVIPKDVASNLGENVSPAMGGFAKSINSAMGGFANAAGAMMAAAEAVAGFIQKLIDFIPSILDAFTKIFTSAAELPLKIAESFKNLLTSIGTFISDFLPNLITGIESILNSFVDFVTEGFFAAFERLFEKFPDILEGFVDRLPELVERFVSGLIGSMPRIAIAFAEMLIDHGPRIAMKIALVLAIEIPKAIVKGIIRGADIFIKRLQAFFSGKKFKMPDDLKNIPKQINDGAKNLGKSIAKESSNIFKVIDLEEGMGKTDISVEGPQKIIESVNDILKRWLANLKRAWLWIYNKILKPILSGLKEVWMWVWEAFNKAMALVGEVFTWIVDGLMEFGTMLSDTWSWIYDTILEPFLDGLKSIMNGFYSILARLIDFVSKLGSIFSNMWESVKSALSGFLNVFKGIGPAILEGLKSAVYSVGDLFTGLGSKIWGGLKKGLDTLGSFFKNLFDKLNPANLFEKIFRIDYMGTDTIEETLGIDVPFAKFASGGLVGGNAKVSGDSLTNDTVLAMLSPGEAVIKRTIMEDPVKGNLIRQIMDDNLPQYGFGIPEVTVGGTLGQIGESAKGAANDVIDGGADAWEQTKETLGEAWEGMKELFSGFLGPAWEQVAKEVFGPMFDKMWEHNKFHKGGFVGASKIPHFAMGGEVPATLQRGEYVINKGAVSSLGLGNLNAMNKTGQMPQQGQSTNMSISINIEASSQSLDESFVRNKLMPAIKSEFKRSSQRGEFLISSKGVRA